MPSRVSHAVLRWVVCGSLVCVRCMGKGLAGGWQGPKPGRAEAFRSALHHCYPSSIQLGLISIHRLYLPYIIYTQHTTYFFLF